MPRIVDGLIAEIEQEAATTKRVLERVPGDKFDWQPHEKSMTLGKLAYHVASVPGSISRWLERTQYDVSELVGDPAGDPDGLMARFEESINNAKSALDKFDDEQMFETWALTKDGAQIMAMPRFVLVRAIMLNHWYHHRGQLTVYLRMHDVPIPSIYGPSADENPFA